MSCQLAGGVAYDVWSARVYGHLAVGRLGAPPGADAAWRRVADTLRKLHRLTQGRPRCPGWQPSTDLLCAQTGTKIDLGAMPPEGVARCRAP